LEKKLVSSAYYDIQWNTELSRSVLSEPNTVKYVINIHSTSVGCVTWNTI